MRIALVSEGTYPFAMGGVSVWFDQLIRGMPQHSWGVVALTVDGTEEPMWEAPPNLVGVRTIPLWGPHRFRPGAEVGEEFVFPFSVLVASMMAPVATRSEQASKDRTAFLVALEALHDLAQRQDVADALTSPAALTVLMDEWNSLYGDGLSLGDALQVALLLEHMLRPLFADAVHADLVHCSMNGLSMLVAMAAKWTYGTPVLMSEHGIYLRERYLSYVEEDAPHAVKVLVLSFFRLLAGAGYLVADALAPHSSYNRRWQLENGARPERMWTMYNGVSPAHFPEAVGEPHVPTVVFMGRIDPLKDLHTLVRAFEIVHAEMPEAVLRIYGGTAAESRDYRDSCVKLVHTLGLEDCVVFEGRVDSPVEAYHAGSVVALSSISEGFPYTVVEAMACARTVVCTDVGGVKEAVGACGLVVPPRDSAAFAAACLRLLRDHELRRSLAAGARARILEHFTLDHSLAAYSRLYDHLTGVAPQEGPPPGADGLEWTALDASLVAGPGVGER
ncbi:GT4 family glycosyltransferase PelF [Nocardioides marmoribigeumensis]|uniref:Glycosyltransferase involved in cell wall biosynthesis n=1 Tax=Nocardioides marmoribigeumensis TaxID=433649 RepID=A0ABU2BWX3_9ACTN|nr:GT4 family glycosyltransferase PelF [Nocardioides marmoribigeumensis]MDR7362389.1 glycosyltransferase involved in cell wall biosynthesis [Nocardioides marmoribigeumensis]